MSSSSTFVSSLQEALSSKVSAFISWIAAGVGLATVAGWVSLLAGILSTLWITVQLWNYFTFTYPKNLRERQKDELKALKGKSVKELEEEEDSDYCPP